MDKPIQIFKTLKGKSQYFAAYDASMRLWPVPYTTRYVTTPYGQTQVIACGPENAFPVVLLHAGYASSTMWFPNITDLSRKYRICAVDTLGEPGKSIPAQPTASRRDGAAWLEAVLDGLGISRAHIIGLSRGGWLALNFAIVAPHRLGKIVLLSPAASFISLTPFFQTMAAAVIRIPLKPVLNAALNGMVKPGFTINRIFARQFVSGLQYWNWKVNSQGYSGIMPSLFSEDELCTVQNPILMVIGDHDRLNPPKALEREAIDTPHPG